MFIFITTHENFGRINFYLIEIIKLDPWRGTNTVRLIRFNTIYLYIIIIYRLLAKFDILDGIRTFLCFFALDRHRRPPEEESESHWRPPSENHLVKMWRPGRVAIWKFCRSFQLQVDFHSAVDVGYTWNARQKVDYRELLYES